MTDTKHSPLPWHLSTEKFDDWGTIKDANSHLVDEAMEVENITATEIEYSRATGVDPTQPNADFIVLACNAYYSDQATIAAQAKRIAWLERPVSDEEIAAAPQPIFPDSCKEFTWSSKQSLMAWQLDILERGLCYATEANAETVADAMLALVRP